MLVFDRVRFIRPFAFWNSDPVPRVLHECGVLLVPDWQAVVLTSGIDPVHHELTVPRPVPVGTEVEFVPAEIANRGDIRVTDGLLLPLDPLLRAQVRDSGASFEAADVLSPALSWIAHEAAAEVLSCALVSLLDVIVHSASQVFILQDRWG